jgi:hypothetical protein
MWMRKTLHEKPFFLRIRAEAELDDVAFLVYADCFCRQVLEKIFERFEIEFGEELGP